MRRSKIINLFGCSFTNWRRSGTWGDIVRKKYGSNFLVNNYGWPGSSNDEQFKRVLKSIEEIDSQKKYMYIIQLTGLERVAVNNKNSPSLRNLCEDLKFNWLSPYTSASEGFKIDNFWKEYFKKEWTPEKHLNRLFSNILKIQNTLDGFQNVEYVFFLGWDIFCARSGSVHSMWEKDNKYINLENSLLVEEYPACKKIWNQINLEKFWFFENEKVKFGGLTQWVQYNLDPKDWWRDYDRRDFHPSDKAHKIFAERVIIPIIDDKMNIKQA
jgi:hypothetical protein